MAALSLPMLGSLVAEPLTGLVDTLLVARLGATQLAALGVATTLLSSVLWAFNFLGIGTQTAVARADGEGRSADGAGTTAVALALAVGIGLALWLLASLAVEPAARFMGAAAGTLDDAASYLRIRLVSAPAVLVMMVAFGALRGLQDMRTPLWIAVGANVLNVLLDVVLIFGVGPFPRLELVGAAWASSVSLYFGAGVALALLVRRLSLPHRIAWQRMKGLLVVGRDLLVRTAALLAFVALGVRSATLIGPEAGAAHALVRSVFVFSAFVLDAYAHAAQSLVSYFLGQRRVAAARRVAVVGLQWSLATGVVAAVAMVAATPLALQALPDEARGLAAGAWLLAALAQPISAVSFATDGIHWGAGDYAYLRRVMLSSSLLGGAALLALDASGSTTLEGIWVVTIGWLAARGLLGGLRVWPGLGAAPLASGRQG